MFKDYDISVLYHPCKVNVAAYGLSRITMGSVSHVEESKKNLVKDVHRFDRFGVRLEISPSGDCIVHQNSFIIHG